MTNRRPIKSGRLEYTTRAFEQDAGQAIRGDIVRALIELLTNADDAYDDCGRSGDIVVQLRPTEDRALPLEVTVRDSASGLAGPDLERHFTTLGGEKKTGSTSRGLLGRGAKDTASLGRLVVETVKDGGYSRIDIERTGAFSLMASDEAASDEDLARLGFESGGCGLSAQVSLNPQAANLVAKLPKLSDQLSRHAQLRELVARQNVIVRDARRRSEVMTSRLIPPALPGAVVLDELIAVAGYEDVRLKLRRMDRPDPSSVDPWSDQGLLIKSDRTIFENTWLELDRGHPAASYFAGEVVAPQAATLIRQFDSKGPTDINPTRLLLRDREGLDAGHPYRQALKSAVLTAVLPFFDEVEREVRASRSEGQKLKADLEDAAQALRGEVAKILGEIEEDLGGNSGVGDDTLPALAVIPPRRKLRTGERATLSLRARAIPTSPGVAFVADQSEDGVVLSVTCSVEPWEKHPHLDAFRSQLYVDAGGSEGTAEIHVIFGELQATAVIDVDNTVVPEDPPTTLAFVPDDVGVSPNRARRLVLRAPMGLEGAEVLATCSGNDVVTITRQPPRLRVASAGNWCEAILRVEAGSEIGRCRIDASAGGESASCSIEVRRPTSPDGLDLEFELLEGNRAQRAVLRRDAGALSVALFADHPSYNGVFGRLDPNTSRFPGEDSPAARAVIAEVLSDELASYLTEQDFTKRPERYTDAARILRQRTQYGLRLLPIAHRILRPPTTAPAP